MRQLFKHGTNLAEAFDRPNAAGEFRREVTRRLREGMYAVNPDSSVEEFDRPLRPLQMRQALRIRTIEQANTALAKSRAGELVTADSLLGLQPHGPVDVYRPEIPIDDQWMSIFRFVGSNSDSESYVRGKGNIKFKQLKAPGDRADPSKFEGSLIHLGNVEDQAEFGYQQSWIDDNKIYQFDNVNADVQEAAADMRALYFYGLLMGASFTSTAYATSWIKTINLAILRLRTSKTLGPNQTPLIAAPLDVMDDILQAVRDTLVSTERGARLIQIPDLLFTAYIDEKKVRAVAPKRRFIDQERTALEMSGPTREPGTFVVKASWRQRYAGAVLDNAAGETITYS